MIDLVFIAVLAVVLSFFGAVFFTMGKFAYRGICKIIKRRRLQKAKFKVGEIAEAVYQYNKSVRVLEVSRYLYPNYWYTIQFMESKRRTELPESWLIKLKGERGVSQMCLANARNYKPRKWWHLT